MSATITIAGHIGRDAETRQVGDHSVTEFSVATNRKVRGEEATTWYRCSMWGSRGESLARYLTRGGRVTVVGEFVPREYATDGQQRVSYDVRVYDIALQGGGAETSRRDESPRGRTAARPAGGAHADDAVPFGPVEAVCW